MNSIAILTATTLLSAALSLSACKSTKHAASDAEQDVETVETGSAGEQGSVGKTAPVGAEEVNDARQSVKQLFGEWVWVKTACCGRMMGETFPKEGEPDRIISFSPDGSASYFTDETKEKTTVQPYKISSLGQNQLTVAIGEKQPAIFMIDGESLVLSWGYIDGQMEYYTRVSK